MLERSGRGHNPAGVNATKPGACAVLCHACPQPGKNLLDGWETALAEKQYVFMFFSQIGCLGQSLDGSLLNFSLSMQISAWCGRTCHRRLLTLV